MGGLGRGSLGLIYVDLRYVLGMQKIGDPISICILHILVGILPPQVLYITYIPHIMFPCFWRHSPKYRN
jgi:hypothetical protein